MGHAVSLSSARYRVYSSSSCCTSERHQLQRNALTDHQFEFPNWCLRNATLTDKVRADIAESLALILSSSNPLFEEQIQVIAIALNYEDVIENKSADAVLTKLKDLRDNYKMHLTGTTSNRHPQPLGRFHKVFLHPLFSPRPTRNGVLCQEASPGTGARLWACAGLSSAHHG